MNCQTAFSVPHENKDDFARPDEHSKIHQFGKGRLCVTGERARELSPLEAMLQASDGFIPLWEKNVTLRYRFDWRTLSRSGKTKEEILALFNKAVNQWGDAAPVSFTESSTAWDFEFVILKDDDCDQTGCVLASAFFPGGGQQQLVIYPKMFTQEEPSQVETLVHELGHIFGLRHWFALLKERRWRAVPWGTQNPISIMNYGDESKLTEEDKIDLKLLYAQARNRTLTSINGTPIVLFEPYSAHVPIRNKPAMRSSVFSLTHAAHPTVITLSLERMQHLGLLVSAFQIKVGCKPANCGKNLVGFNQPETALATPLAAHCC
ncbi:hypothetical protein BGZ75_001071 [Mortierella antarctica]|nr:hypothetical protein BGZ75_001071 [Mortierella antarctica]